jgi:hypothetical protein
MEQKMGPSIFRAFMKAGGRAWEWPQIQETLLLSGFQSVRYSN